MAISTRNIAGRTYYEANGNLYASLDAAQAAMGIDNDRGTYAGPGAGLGGARRMKPGHAVRLGLRGPTRAQLGDLRGVVNPIKTSIGVATVTAAAAGTVTATTQVDQVLPAGCVLYVSGAAASLAALDGLATVLIDGQNIFLNSQTVPTDAINPQTQNAVGILIPKPITKSVGLSAVFNAAGSVRFWFAAPSIEIEQVLDTCDCD